MRRESTPSAAPRTAAALAVLVLAAVVCGAARAAPRPSSTAAGAAAPPAGFRWFEPAPPPAHWKQVGLPSGGGTLFYPRSLTPVRHDRSSISVGAHDRQGRIAVYLNVTPKQGNETLRNWADFRLRHNREESDAVHEDARASGLWFVGGRGSCVIDEYATRVKVHHYREIACFVQGRTSASVIVAAALRSNWTRARALLERAVESYQVG